MALRTSDTDDKNAINDQSQAYYDEKFNDIARQEQNAGRDSVDGYDRKSDGLDDHPISANDASGKSGDLGNTKNILAAQDAESNPNNINYTGSGKQQASTSFIAKRKKGATAALITILFGGFVGLGGIFGGPGLLIVNLAEVMTDKFNTQLSSMDTRTTKVLNAKIAGTTSGVCSTGVSVMCKYSSLSEKQLAKITAPGTGIEVKDKGTTLIAGRTKPTEFIFTDSKGVKTSISAKEFPKFYATNPEFRASMKTAYNPKYAGFSDFVSRKVFGWLKTSKKAPFAETDATDEEKAKAVHDTVKSGTTDVAIKRPTQASDGSWTDSNGNKIDANQAAKLNAAADSLGTIANDAATIEKTGLKAGGNVLEKGANLISVTGLASDACTAYGMINAVANGAKVIRAAQMARYAMIFLTTASMIKAGTAQASDVSYLGNTLTKTTKDNPKTATDSYGYQYAAGTVSGPIDAPASEYLAGGGLGGEFSAMTATVLGMIGGTPKAAKQTCQIVNNAAVQVTAFIAGVALLIIPGGQPIQGAKIAGQVALGIALVAATMILPQMLANMIAGTLVDNATSGEGSGNAIASGSSGMMSTVAGGGGNAPLTPDQAVAYQADQSTTLAQYVAEDRLTTSPLDATNAHTFMGMMVTKLLPYASNLSTVSGVLSSSSSLVSSSFGTLLSSPTRAVSASDYTKCQDSDYHDLGLATDPFCNPIRGIPAQYLGDDPNTINQRLIAQGLIDETTGNPVGDYATFVTDCIDRTRPLGDAGPAADENTGSDCFIKDQHTADFYVHYVDQRVLTGMEEGYDGGDAAPAAAPAAPTTSNGDGVSTGVFAWPVGDNAQPKAVSRCYYGPDFKTGHLGIDLGVAVGSDVLAADGGTVTWIVHETDPLGVGNFGNAISIQHADGVFTTYAHASQLLVKVGDKVSKGQKIAVSGNTGNTNGAHLHFEVSRQSSPYVPDLSNTIDPLNFIKIPAGWSIMNPNGCHS